jgi:nucleotide-binding universal stress UspA family protein
MTRLGHVLCPVDLRRPSHGALAFASMLAEEFGSILDAVYVAEGKEPRSTPPFVPSVHAAPKSSGAHGLGEELSTLVAARSPHARSTAEVRFGRPLPVLLEQARQRKSDLIVLGSPHQPSSWRCTARLGDALAAGATCPVLTVPDRDLPAKPTRILLPIELSGATDVAVEWTAFLASRFDACVDVVHGERCGDAPRALGDIECRFGRSGVRATMHAARGQSVLADVVGRSAEDPFQLVVVGVERRDAARLDVSFLERLRNRTHMPVLSVVAQYEPRTMPSLDPLGRLRELFPPPLQAVAHPHSI